MISKKKAPLAKPKKPRSEQLLDRIDKDPNDRDAWTELARGSPAKVKKARKPRREGQD